MTTLVLTPVLRRQIEREARAAYPNECCGLLEGERYGDTVTATAAHATRNIADASDRFEIEPADQFRILRGARDRGCEIVGCYHSHPNGEPEPSAHDRAGGAEEGFLWVIAATMPSGRPVELAAFSFAGGRFAPVMLAESGSLDPARPAGL